MAMLKLFLGVGKARPTCCRVVCLGGFLWVVSRVIFCGLYLGVLSVSRV